MKPNLPVNRAFLARTETFEPVKTACHVCDVETASGPGTYASQGSVTLVTGNRPTSASVVGDQAEVCLDDRDGTLDEREAMVVEGGVSPAFARLFAVLQVARPASVGEVHWYQAINDAGLFLDQWGRTAERLGWSARDIVGPAYTPAALAWALQGARVVTMTATTARLSDGRIFTRTL